MWIQLVVEKEKPMIINNQKENFMTNTKFDSWSNDQIKYNFNLFLFSFTFSLSIVNFWLFNWWFEKFVRLFQVKCQQNSMMKMKTTKRFIFTTIHSKTKTKDCIFHLRNKKKTLFTFKEFIHHESRKIKLTLFDSQKFRKIIWMWVYSVQWVHCVHFFKKKREKTITMQFYWWNM